MTQLEADLREWMHERAGRVHASPDLLGADYHRSTRPLLPRLVIGGGLAIAAGVTAGVLSLAGGAGTAFAGWTPRPTAPTRAQRVAAEAYCAQNVPDPRLPLKLDDTRGPFTILIYSNGAASDFCTVGPSFQNASGWSTSRLVTPPPGRLFLWTDHIAAEKGQSFGTMIARAGNGVRGANLTLEDGSVVTATVENGWAVAWWPGTQHLASAQLATPSGTETQTFPRYPCDVHHCHRDRPHSNGAVDVSGRG